jgi:glycosyltransferase involved in cell wall biosynthesis
LGAEKPQMLSSVECAIPYTSAWRRAAPLAETRRLKLCFIAETAMTGVGRHVTDVIKAMTARGHEVHLLHSIARSDEALLAELELSPGFRRQAFPMRRQPHWSDVPVLIALARHLRRFGPFDVIHGHSSKGGVYARVLSLLLPGTCLYTPHAFITMAPHLSGPKRAVYATIERCLARLTDILICCSHEEAEHAASLGIGGERIALIPNAIAPFDLPAAPRLRERLGLPSDTVIIGFVGRLDEQKAPRVLVEAIIKVLLRRHDVHVVMIGAGPLRAELEALTHACGIAQHFLWLGNIPSRSWIAGFDVLAMPSLYEGFSYVLLEGLCAGVPIVCTPVGGVKEAGLADGVHGFIVPIGDSHALADRLSRLIADPQLRQAMGRRAREQSTRLSLEEMMDRLEATYRRVARAAVAFSSPAPSGL